MRTICDRLPRVKRRCIVAIGVFDGVHRGHQTVLSKLTERAKKLHLSSLVITFDPHPRAVLGRQFWGNITTREDKQAIMARAGIDYLWFLKTDRDLLGLTAEEFLLFVGRHFAIDELVVGDDFRFGKDAAHGAHTMDKLAKEFGFRFFILPKTKVAGKSASSSYIRNLLQAGRIRSANRLLGRDYAFKGKVVEGEGRGRTLGFPTANIRIGDHILPAHGVYAGYAVVGKVRYPAAISIGTKPTFTAVGDLTVEVYLLGFHGNLVGKNIELCFLDRLRDEKRFASVAALISAIRRDVARVKQRYESLVKPGCRL